MSIEISGVLDCDAWTAVRRVRDTAIIVQIRANSSGSIFEAAVIFGDQPGQDLRAADTARRLKRGMPATLQTEDLRWVMDHGRARFVAAGKWAVRVGGVPVGPA